MKISQLETLSGNVPANSFAVIAVQQADGSFLNYKLDMSNISVSGGGGGSGGSGGAYVTRAEVQQMIDNAITGSLQQIYDNLNNVIGDV